MNTENNSVSFSFRNHDTDVSIDISGDNVDEVKLMKLLTTYLTAIQSRITLNL